MFVAFIIVFQDDALHLFGDVLPCTFTEKGSYSVGGAVDLPEEIQRLHIGASAEPRYALLLGHCRKVVCNAVKLCIDFVTTLRDRLHTALVEMFADGTIEKILAEYGLDPADALGGTAGE